MISNGTVYENRQITNSKLFINAFYATGFPVTEAYWADVVIAGTSQLVLMQCFQRRCLTYNPQNDPAWRVEMGNVGLHYHGWRYPTKPRPTPVEPVPAEADVYYQPDMSTLALFDDGVSRTYFSPELNCYVIENNYVGGETWSAVWWYYNESYELLDYSISVDIVQLTNGPSSFAQAGVWTRYGPIDESATQYQAVYTGLDTNGFAGSWYLGATAERLHEYEQVPELNSGYLAVNNLKVIVSYGHGWVFVNGVFVHEFDMPEGGNVDVDGFGLIVYNLTEEVSAGKVGFRNLTVRYLAAAE
jgi:hypothetical protein